MTLENLRRIIRQEIGNLREADGPPPVWVKHRETGKIFAVPVIDPAIHDPATPEEIASVRNSLPPDEFKTDTEKEEEEKTGEEPEKGKGGAIPPDEYLSDAEKEQQEKEEDMTPAEREQEKRDKELRTALSEFRNKVDRTLQMVNEKLIRTTLREMIISDRTDGRVKQMLKKMQDHYPTLSAINYDTQNKTYLFAFGKKTDADKLEKDFGSVKQKAKMKLIRSAEYPQDKPPVFVKQYQVLK